MRWRGTEEWIRPDRQTHPAIIDVVTYEQALARIDAQRRGANQRSPKASSTGRVYPLTGRCFCSACDSRLSARFYASKKKDGPAVSKTYGSWADRSTSWVALQTKNAETSTRHSAFVCSVNPLVTARIKSVRRGT